MSKMIRKNEEYERNTSFISGGGGRDDCNSLMVLAV